MDEKTISRVIGGHFASLILPQLVVRTYAHQIGPFVHHPIEPIGPLGAYSFADPKRESEIAHFLTDLQAKGESCGGGVSIEVDNCPPGLGEPAFDKLKADLAKAILSIGAVVSFSYGLGSDMSSVAGSELVTSQAPFGGIEGGISNGLTIKMQATIRPPSTVGTKAKQGRHDPCIVPRVIVVIESMVKLVLADHFLRQRAYDL